MLQKRNKKTIENKTNKNKKYNLEDKQILKEIEQDKKFNTMDIKFMAISPEEIKKLEKEEEKNRRINEIKKLEKKREEKIMKIENEKNLDLQIEEKINNVYENLNGLINLGNTCYMNTCLQFLIHCKPFLNKLYKKIPTRVLSREFYNLCELQANSQIANSPFKFKVNFARKHLLYSNFNQHDSQEFCRLLLDDMSRELNKIISLPKYEEINEKLKDKFEISKEFNRLFKQREDSIIVDTFYFQILNIFECKCGHKIYSFENFLDLPLLFPEKTKETIIKLDELLELYFSQEKIEWGLVCPGCNKKNVTHTKQSYFSSLPEILIISLQRYNTKTNKKNDIVVDFVPNLQLFQYADRDLCNYEKYKLINVINHKGKMNSGHYFSYVNIKGNWYEFNDSFCNPINIMKYCSSTAYILIYQRE
jgi:ubiquitin C-terminal hydrolase